MARSPSNSPSTSAGGDPLSQPYVEFGATGLRQFSGYVREEWLRDLQGWKGMRVFREMRDNDPIIGGIFFAVEMLLRGVTFRVVPGSAPDEKGQQLAGMDQVDDDDQAAADFVNSCLADMEQSWPDLMAQMLTFLQYGWAVQEIVFKVRQGETDDPKTNSAYSDGMIGWRKFAPRAQETLLHWEFDEAGDATAMVQLLPTGGPLLRVPLAKCIHLTTVPLKNSPEGRSILRNAYTSYYYKKRIQGIEAVGIERDLAGLPVAWVPAKIMNSDATAADKAQFATWQRIVRDVSRNEQEGLVLPMAFDKDKNPLFKLELLSTGGRRQFDTNQIIDRYDHRICVTVLADFITLGQSGRGQGSYAQAKNKTDMFAAAVIAFLDMITAEFNRKAIPQLLSLNSLKGRCRMEHGEVAQRDLQDFAAAILSVAQAGLLTPDPTLEGAIRTELGLPQAQGMSGDDLNDGGTAGASDVDPARTSSTAPGAGQGQGDDGLASDGDTAPPKRVRSKNPRARA